MTATVIVGTQWGDEGKGKVVDIYSQQADMVVRFGGGANAGHTLVVNGDKLVTHLIPSGVLHPGTKCVLGCGMVIDPYALVQEITTCQNKGLLPDEDLFISERAHVILPFHKVIEKQREKRHRIGTTLRGIGPCYESKAGRRGIRMADLTRPEVLREIIDRNVAEINAISAGWGQPVISADTVHAIWTDAKAVGEVLSKYITNCGALIENALKDKQAVLLEGAQGAMLDVDHGTYPYVTSSSTIAAGASQGTGIGPTHLRDVVGITKAYLTRVGDGPFPTEEDSETGEWIRQKGAEFGATTGRPRRCGWLDLVALKHAVRINGITRIAFTKLDVLNGLDTVKVCVGYRVRGKDVYEVPVCDTDLSSAQPMYEEYEGWGEIADNCQNIEDLPQQARAYIAAISEKIGVPMGLISIGPGRKQTIITSPAFLT